MKPAVIGSGDIKPELIITNRMGNIVVRQAESLCRPTYKHAKSKRCQNPSCNNTAIVGKSHCSTNCYKEDLPRLKAKIHLNNITKTGNEQINEQLEWLKGENKVKPKRSYTTVSEDFANLTDAELKEMYNKSFPDYEPTSEEEWKVLLNKNEIKTKGAK